MNDEQITSMIMTIKQDMAAMRENVKSAHKRIDDNDALTAQIHKLAASVETLAFQVKTQNERMEKIVDALQSQIKTQGERIVILERSILTVDRNEKSIVEQNKKIDALEKKPGLRWDALVSQVITIAVAAAISFFTAKFSN